MGVTRWLSYEPTRSAISIRAILNGQDPKDPPIGGKEHTIAAEAQTDFATVLTLERLHIADASDSVMIKAIEQMHGCGAIESANIGARLIGPFDAKRHSL